MRHTRSAVLLACAAAVLGFGPSAFPSEDRVVPVYLESDHHLVFENRLVRVLDIRVPAGHVSSYHIHANPLVSVTVQDARSWSQELGEDRGPASPRGEVPSVGVNWDRALPYTHRVGNVDTIAYHRIAAEWLQRPVPDCTPIAAMPAFKLIREGQYGRIYEIHLLPGQTTPAHRHSCPGLTVQGSAGVLKSIGARPAALGGKGAGKWFWHDPDFRHALRNSGRTPITVYEIDWR